MVFVMIYLIRSDEWQGVSIFGGKAKSWRLIIVGGYKIAETNIIYHREMYKQLCLLIRIYEELDLLGRSAGGIYNFYIL